MQDALPDVAAPAANGHDAAASHGAGNFWLLSLGSIGVVFGDIGTSPLYALQASLAHAKDSGLADGEVVGILSLMVLAQTALGRRTTLIFLLGVVGSALFSGDAIITAAISVLSALEG